MTDTTFQRGTVITSQWLNEVDRGLYGVANITSLRALSAPTGPMTLTTHGYYTAGDGGSAQYWWNSTDTHADNSGTIIAPTGLATGRWNLVTSGRINVKQFGATGNGTTDDTVAIQRALDQNLGRDVFVPSGVYICSAPITMGARVAPATTSSFSTFSYNSLVGEGPSIYADNTTASPYATGHTPQSILKFTVGSGIKINNSYQRLEHISIIGTAVGGSDPSAADMTMWGNIGVTLSGGDHHGGYSLYKDVRVSGFDTGWANNDFIAYCDFENCDTIACDNGWVIHASVFDFRIIGGKTVSCDKVGHYFWSEGQKFTVIGHMFEICGTITNGVVSRSSASIIVDVRTAASYIGCTLSDDCSVHVAKNGYIEFDNCNIETATPIHGPGVINLNNSIGKAIDIPLNQDISAWNLTNVTVGSVNTGPNPNCYHLTSSVKAATQVDLTVAIPSAQVDTKAISYNAAGNTVRHAGKFEFQIKYDATAGKAPAGTTTGSPPHWSGGTGFLPSMTLRAYDSSSDGWADISHNDATAWTFGDHGWWTVTIETSFRATGVYITDTLKEFTLAIQLNDGNIDYVATPLSCWIRGPKLTFYQSLSEL